MILNIFSCAYWSSVQLLWKNVYLGLLSNLNWMVWFFNIVLYELLVLYTLDVNSLSIASSANIFSHSVGCLFLPFSSFSVQIFLSLIRFHLLIFAFTINIILPWESELRNIASICVRIVCLCSLLGVLLCHVLYL